MSALPEDGEILDNLTRGLAELDEHQEEYALRTEMYEGTHKEVIAHPTLSKLLAKYSEEFTLNYAAVPVDALIDRVDLSGLTVAGDETLTNRLKADFWDENELDDDADDYHSKAASLGDYYAIVWPRPGEDGEPSQVVEIFGKSPMNTRILYDRQNARIPDFGLQRWRIGKKTFRLALYYDDATVDFITQKGEDAKASDYTRFETNPGDQGITPNEYGFPLFHWRADRKPYGRPVNQRAYGPQNAIQKINATHLAAIDYMGFPQRWAILDPLAESDDDIADDFNDSDVNFPPATATDPSRVTGDKNTTLKASPGSAWLLAGVKSVGQFTAAESTPFLDSEQFQIRAAATLTRTPLYEFDLDGSGDQPSGEARRRADGPITKHAAKVKGAFGETWSQIGEFVLKIWGIGEAKTVEPNWLPSEVATDKDGIALVASKIENGVPPRQALLEAGYTTEQVDEWMPESAIPLTPALLSQIALALKDLGGAKTLGVVSMEDVRLMLPDILKGKVPEPPPAPVVVAPAAPGEPPMNGKLDEDTPPKGKGE